MIRRHRHRWGFGGRIRLGPFFLDWGVFRGGRAKDMGFS